MLLQRMPAHSKPTQSLGSARPVPEQMNESVESVVCLRCNNGWMASYPKSTAGLLHRITYQYGKGRTATKHSQLAMRWQRKPRIGNSVLPVGKSSWVSTVAFLNQRVERARNAKNLEPYFIRFVHLVAPGTAGSRCFCISVIQKKYERKLM